ncbi:hypothetical protein BCR44DRAFT_1449691, partial [Catenaria anguillulae PL171]
SQVGLPKPKMTDGTNSHGAAVAVILFCTRPTSLAAFHIQSSVSAQNVNSLYTRFSIGHPFIHHVMSLSIVPSLGQVIMHDALRHRGIGHCHQ